MVTLAVLVVEQVLAAAVVALALLVVMPQLVLEAMEGPEPRRPLRAVR